MSIEGERIKLGIFQFVQLSKKHSSITLKAQVYNQLTMLCLRQIKFQFGRTQKSAFARLLNSLAVLEQQDGALANSSLSAVTAAQKLGASVTGIIAGSNIKRVAVEAAKVKGLEKIISIESGAYDKVSLFRSF